MRWLLIVALAFLTTLSIASADQCIDCHKQTTPGIVEQWLSGNMSKYFGCGTCHGTEHRLYDDWGEGKNANS